MITIVFIAGMGILFTALVIYCTRDLGRGRDPFAHLPVPGDGQSFGAMPPEIAHEEHLPAQLAACPATPPDQDSGVWADRNAGRFDSALGSPAHDHALAGTGNNAAGLPTLANPQDTLAPALQDATPEGGPSAGARAPEDNWSDPFISGYCADGDHGACMPDGPSECPCDCHGWQDEDYEREQVTKTPPEPPAGDEDPGPDGAPEGDGQAARPPQGTTGPGDLLAKATALVAALPVDKYLDEAAAVTAYADDAPWNPLSAETIARGIPVIKADA